MELMVIQQPMPEIIQKGRYKHFVTQRNSSVYDITIEEGVSRKITISSNDAPPYEEKLQVLYDLESLLMLFEGQFHPVLHVYENGTEITQSWKNRALPSCESADFMKGESNVLLDFSQVLNSRMLTNWRNLQVRLDLIHKMNLYCVSSVRMPVDMKCAFMIESFLGIAELLGEKKRITLPSVRDKQSTLKYYIQTTIKAYGRDIFIQELAKYKTFAQILVNSRNRIAHIKTNQKKVVLDGKESVMYLMKLSLLYRKILFELLGVSPQTYNSNLANQVSLIDKHEATKQFLKKLNPKQTN